MGTLTPADNRAIPPIPVAIQQSTETLLAEF